MNETLNYGALAEMMKERLKEFSLNEEYKNQFKKCFEPNPVPRDFEYSKYFIHSKSMEIFEINQLMPYFTDLAQKKEDFEFMEKTRREKAEISEIVKEFLDKMASLFQDCIDKVFSKFFPENEVFVFMEDFQDGQLNNDSEFIKRFEGVIDSWYTFAEGVPSFSRSKLNSFLEKASSQLSGSIESYLKEIEDLTNKQFAFPKSLEPVSHRLLPNTKLPFLGGMSYIPEMDRLLICSNRSKLFYLKVENLSTTSSSLNSYLDNCEDDLMIVEYSQFLKKTAVCNSEKSIVRIFSSDFYKEREFKVGKDLFGASPLSMSWVAENGSYNSKIVIGFETGNIHIYKETGELIKNSRFYSDPITFLVEIKKKIVYGDLNGRLCFFSMNGVKESVIDPLHQGGHWITDIKLSHSKDILASCSRSGDIIGTNIVSNDVLWHKSLNLQHYRMAQESNEKEAEVRVPFGLIWVPGDIYLMVLLEKNSILCLNRSSGETIIELSTNCNAAHHAFVLVPKTKEIIIGTEKGEFHKLLLKS